MANSVKNLTHFLQKSLIIFKKHKILVSIVSVFLVLSILASVVIVSLSGEKNTNDSGSDKETIISSETVSGIVSSEMTSLESEVSSVVSSSESSSSDIVSEKPVSSDVSSSVANSSKVNSSKVSSSKKPSKPQNTSSKVTSSKKPATNKVNASKNNNFKYNSNTDINDNVFLDSLVYTGYNLKKHIADGNMWVYILASRKRGLGYLSDIGYAGGSTGYETKNGKPDIKAFERKGLVCASFVTYVYFNYLPNVAGIDTSSLTKPNKSYSANDWYIAAKNWVKKGYSKTISFKASKTSSGYINFKPSENIPIGSLMFCCDAKNRSDYCSHVSIYAGYKNGYHWVYHVGNQNGPEFCAMERMHFGPDPQWPINIITTPKNIRMEAALEITVKDDSAKPIKGVKFSLKNLKTGKTVDLGKTNAKGVIVKENLSYGKYQLIQTAVKGYESKKLTQNIELTTKNNSYNKISITNTKIKPVESSKVSSSQKVSTPSGADSSVLSKPINTKPANSSSSKVNTSAETSTSNNVSSQKEQSKNESSSSQKVLDSDSSDISTPKTNTEE